MAARPKARPKKLRLARMKAARPAVFTSLDGTLLDFDTFNAQPSRALVKRLSAANVPVVPVSVMTLPEVEPIAKDLGMQHAMIIEAGGAIARWKNGTWEVEPHGPDAGVLLDVVSAIEAASGAHLSVYSVLDDSEAALLSGRTGEMLRASTQRCFSEPFVIESGDLGRVMKAAAALGFEVRRGRRFLYLCRPDAEGEAFLRLREELQCDLAIAVGGSPVDGEFLARSDVPIIVPRPSGEADPELVAKVPQARIAPAPGSAGWAKAVEEVWSSITLSPRSRSREVAR